MIFCLIILGKIGFSRRLPVATARGELEIYRPANVACEQAFSRAAWGEGKAKRPVDRPLGPPFHGTRCASDPDASSYWREH